MEPRQNATGESLLHNLGLFSRFPRGRTSCIICPPGRNDTLRLRVLWRAILPFFYLGLLLPDNIIPKNRFAAKVATVIIVCGLLVLVIPALVYGLIVESLIESIAIAKENMNALISALVVFALIAVPSYLLYKSPSSYNVPTQIMFSVFLAAASTLLGILVNNKRARRDATAKWLPAAETACKQLLTLSSTAERMKRIQAQACDTIAPVMSDGPQEALKPVKALISLQCRETAEKLATLRDHIENSISHWQVFIGANCEGDECSSIEARLDQCRQQLFSRIETDFCAGGASVRAIDSRQVAAQNAASSDAPSGLEPQQVS